jgi:hypothetical protein
MYNSVHHVIQSPSQPSWIATSLIAAGLAQSGLQVTYFVDQPSTCSSLRMRIMQTED